MERVIEVTDPAIARVLAHPLRRIVLTALRGRTASPSELAAELDESLPKLSYHVRQLAAFGLIKLVSEQRRRGVTEHFYTAAGRTNVPAAVFQTLPSGTQHALVSSWLADAGHTIEDQRARGAYESEDARLARAVVQLDEPARKQLVNAVDDLYELALALEREAIARPAPHSPSTVIALLS